MSLFFSILCLPSYTLQAIDSYQQILMPSGAGQPSLGHPEAMYGTHFPARPPGQPTASLSPGRAWPAPGKCRLFTEGPLSLKEAGVSAFWWRPPVWEGSGQCLIQLRAGPEPAPAACTHAVIVLAWPWPLWSVALEEGLGKNSG